VVAINGDPTAGWDGDRAAKSLRGRSGSSVLVRFARRSEQVPGVAGRPEQPPRIDVHQARHPSPDVPGGGTTLPSEPRLAGTASKVSCVKTACLLSLARLTACNSLLHG